MMLLALLIQFTEISMAKDFGTQGHTFEIEEQDMLEFINSRLNELEKNGVLALKQEEMKAKSEQYINRPHPVENISPTTQEKTWEFDPTYIVGDKDIKDHEGKLIQAKGRVVNPLETQPLTHKLLFIDGDNKTEVKWALDYAKKAASKIILVKGSPIELMKQNKIRIYFDQKGVITKRFGITQVPALVAQKGTKLLIQEIKLRIKNNG